MSYIFFISQELPEILLDVIWCCHLANGLTYLLGENIAIPFLSVLLIDLLTLFAKKTQTHCHDNISSMIATESSESCSYINCKKT